MFDFPNPPLTVGQQVTGPGGAVYQWDGTKWAALGGSATYVNKGGDTMTGALVLPGNASSALQAVPLQQLTGTVAPAFNDVGRNLVHNPLFNVQQRGQGAWTASGYTADRWTISQTNDTISASIGTIGDPGRLAIGDESAFFALVNTFTGTANGASYVEQHIESVRRLSGKTVTVSFWAQPGAAGQKMAVNIFQVFGTGGSPSAATVGTAASFTLGTTSWTRYSFTTTLASIAGKTFGTNAGTDYTILRFYYSAGASTEATNSGNLGAQSGSINLWGIQLEIGSTVTQLEKLDPNDDIIRCKRFYQQFNLSVGGYSIAGTVNPYGTSILLVPGMRAVPTYNIVSPGYTNASALTIGAGQNAITAGVTVTAAGLFSAIAQPLQLSADL